jgi:hypothetical protein
MRDLLRPPHLTSFGQDHPCPSCIIAFVKIDGTRAKRTWERINFCRNGALMHGNDTTALIRSGIQPGDRSQDIQTSLDRGLHCNDKMLFT